MCTAVYVFKHILFRATFCLVLFRSSCATAEVFFLAGVQFQHTDTHLFHIHKINFIKPGKKSRKQKTYSCKVWRGRKKEGETLVNSGGRAQMVRSAFHLFFIFTSWVVLNRLALFCLTSGRIHTRYFLSKPQMWIFFQDKQILFAVIANHFAKNGVWSNWSSNHSLMVLWMAISI